MRKNSDVQETVNPTKFPTKYLTRKEVSEILSITLPTIHEWSKRGVLTAYRLGNRVYFKSDEIDAAMVKIYQSKGVEPC